MRKYMMSNAGSATFAAVIALTTVVHARHDQHRSVTKSDNAAVTSASVSAKQMPGQVADKPSTVSVAMHEWFP